MNEAVYPYTASPAFLSWPIPAAGDRLERWQNGRCAMCEGSGRLVMDHCHLSGTTRGYLCRGCNNIESRTVHPAFAAWRAGRNPARLLGLEERYVPLFGGDGLALNLQLEAHRLLALAIESADFFTEIDGLPPKDHRITYEIPTVPPSVNAAKLAEAVGTLRLDESA